MLQYIVRRLLQTIPVVIIVSIVVFSMVRMIPGDPAVVLLGPYADPAQIPLLRAKMGLDKPIWVQYLIWIRQMLHGDFGLSFINDFPVSQLMLRKLPATVELAIAGLIVATLISIPLGIISALRHDQWPDHIVTFYNSLALGIPSFWLGILLVAAFSLTLKILPPSGYVSILEDPVAGLKFLSMPAFTLGVYYSAIFARFLKSSILETLFQDYVRTAYAKGLPSHLVISRHVLKNALIPLVTIFGIQFGGLLGGTVIVESVFDWPGLGRLLIQGIQTRDYFIVQTWMLLGVIVYLTVNLVVDLVYGLLDPRIREH